jgi:hypothetical protein
MDKFIFIQSWIMQKLRFFVVCLLIFFSSDNTLGQDQEENFRILFWNVENFFDPFDDSLKLDDEFTPGGNHGWTWVRFNQKLNNVYKVIMSTGWEPPDIIGLCEVENRWVLERLTRMTPLSKFEYKIIHHDSPDLRGIDVVMLYLPSSFRPLKTSFIPIIGLKTGDDPTRDILFVKGIIKSLDTVNIFVNHWPSRYPGLVETIHKRQAAALVLKRKIDSLFNEEPGCKIIAMGDFNDEPWDESISEILGVKVQGDERPPYSGKIVKTEFGVTEAATQEGEEMLYSGKVLKTRSGVSGVSVPGDLISGNEIIANDLYHLVPPIKKSITGTLKFEGRWYLFDQFIISGGLLAKTRSHEIEIVDHDFLLEPDEVYTGKKPYRTYNGYIYKGGYSDHLPIILNLSFTK